MDWLLGIINNSDISKNAHTQTMTTTTTTTILILRQLSFLVSNTSTMLLLVLRNLSIDTEKRG